MLNIYSLLVYDTKNTQGAQAQTCVVLQLGAQVGLLSHSLNVRPHCNPLEHAQNADAVHGHQTQPMQSMRSALHSVHVQREMRKSCKGACEQP